ncbi:hypothetical protein EZMO1_1560 [Endozoicomonas montiporae CL-33]|uniref:Uncharacterized protein n=1 Tax=Endozoicomonas montiporae CL-33 TaxID=570277 RepID=A0A142BAE8_9GAMM|nr:hypothetical protein [Endozoicomonas montiporae]AMO55724.1 hypothetical protein EZMO1_1560 [Endozoicomonas montiporae CL-33]
MPEPGGIQSNANTGVNFHLNPTVKKAFNKIGKAFNRAVFSRPVQKNLIRQHQHPQGLPAKQLHLLNPAQFQRRYAPDSYLLSVQGQTKGL